MKEQFKCTIPVKCTIPGFRTDEMNEIHKLKLKHIELCKYPILCDFCSPLMSTETRKNKWKEFIKQTIEEIEKES